MKDTSKNSRQQAAEPRALQRELAAARQSIRRLEKQHATLLKKTEMLENVLDKSFDGIAMAGRNGRLKFVNPGMAHILGHDVAKLKSIQEWTEHLFPEPATRSQAIDLWEKDAASGSPPERIFHITHKDGEKRWCRVQISPMGNGDFVINSQDVTESRNAQEGLRESEQRWHMLFKNVPDIVAAVDRTGTIVALNRTVSGAPVAEAVGQSFYRYFDSTQAKIAKKSLQRAFRTGRPASFEILGFGAHGPGTGWYETRVAPVKKDNRVDIVILIGTDITDRKRTEIQLRESASELAAQKNELQQKNVALKEILAQIETEKLQIRKRVSANVNKLLMPTLKKLRRKGTSAESRYLDLLEKNLNDLTSAFGSQAAPGVPGLSPKELEICNMIRSGMMSKEIADLLGVSLRTVETHRNNIRKKLDISGKDVNLTTYLRTIE